MGASDSLAFMTEARRGCGTAECCANSKVQIMCRIYYEMITR